MTAMDLWEKIISDLEHKPRDFKTVPRINRPSLNFYAKVICDCIVIDNALNASPSCELSAPRKIKFSDFKKVYSYYDDWKAGIVGVRNKVRQVSRNTAYIFGLINYYRAV